MSGQPDDKKPLYAEMGNQELLEQVENLHSTLKEAQDKAQENWDRLLRKEAELQNIQKRAQQDVTNGRELAIKSFAQDLLEVLDSLEHGVNFAQNGQASAKDLGDGMILTQTVLRNVMHKHGIDMIDPKVGDPFDPNFQEAISMQETKDMEPNRVVAVVQKGYQLQNRLLRPARVVVSKAPS